MVGDFRNIKQFGTEVFCINFCLTLVGHFLKSTETMGMGVCSLNSLFLGAKAPLELVRMSK